MAINYKMVAVAAVIIVGMLAWRVGIWSETNTPETAGKPILVTPLLSQAEDADSSLLKPDTSEIVQLGAEIYAEHCASCHGANLEGQPDWRSPGSDGRLPAPPHDQTGHTWHHADQVLFELTKYGLQKFAGQDYQSNMPAYQEILSDDQIIAVLSFIKSRWPEALRRRHNQLNAAFSERSK